MCRRFGIFISFKRAIKFDEKWGHVVNMHVIIYDSLHRGDVRISFTWRFIEPICQEIAH